MFKAALLITFTVCFVFVFGQNIRYSLRMSRPQSHYFEVDMEVNDLNMTSFDVKMPVWAPGSYLIREFAKNVNLVKAFDQDGTELKVVKKEKNKWTVENGAAKNVHVKYDNLREELVIEQFVDDYVWDVWLDNLFGPCRGSVAANPLEVISESSGGK